MELNNTKEELMKLKLKFRVAAITNANGDIFAWIDFSSYIKLNLPYHEFSKFGKPIKIAKKGN